MRICFNYIFIFILEQRYVNAYVRVRNSKRIASLLQYVCHFTGIDSQIVALQCFFGFFFIYIETQTQMFGGRSRAEATNYLFILSEIPNGM